jgi:hypothetical protein
MKLPRFMMDALVRSRACVAEVAQGRFKVRVARTTEEYIDAFALVRTAYVFMGIEKLSSPELRIVEQQVLPESTVLVCYEGDELVGTMTVTLDSPAGLPLDADYAGDLDALRVRGALLVEYGSLAVVSRCHHDGVPQLLNVAAYRFARERLGATHTVIGVHPRAYPYYRALYGFEHLGAVQSHASLASPVIALVQDMVAYPQFVRSKYRKRQREVWMEHFFGKLPSFLALPPEHLPASELVRWKLPRQVFREIFVDRSDRLATLSDTTRDYLGKHRSRKTLVAGQLLSGNRRD